MTLLQLISLPLSVLSTVLWCRPLPIHRSWLVIFILEPPSLRALEQWVLCGIIMLASWVTEEKTQLVLRLTPAKIVVVAGLCSSAAAMYSVQKSTPVVPVTTGLSFASWSYLTAGSWLSDSRVDTPVVLAVGLLLVSAHNGSCAL
jgi:hypothetical protein